MVPYVLVFTSLEESSRGLAAVIDVLFLIDIVLTFFKGYFNGEELIIDHKRIALRYLLTFFVFDVASTIPTLVTRQNEAVYPTKLFRFIHYYRINRQLDFVLDKILFGFLGYNKTKVEDVLELAKLLIFVVTGTHVLACIWIYLGF